jgi:hypothetical protein
MQPQRETVVYFLAFARTKHRSTVSRVDARETSKRVGSNGSGYGKDQQKSGESVPGLMSQIHDGIGSRRRR